MAKVEHSTDGGLSNEKFYFLALNKFKSAKMLINPCDPENIIFINHDLKGLPYPSYEYLSNAGVSVSDIEVVLDHTSRLKYEKRDFIDPFTLSISELEEWVKSHVAKIYPLIDLSLNASANNGFNEHGLPHAEEILQSSRKLLSDLRIQDEQIVKRAVVESLTHDLGNFISRENHEVTSIFLLEKILPELKIRSEQWKLIRKAILFHNISFIKTLWNENSKAEEKIDILRNILCPDALVLMLSDKTSIGRERLTTKIIDRQSVNEDIHVALNLMALDSHTGFSENRQTFNWLIDFSTEPKLEIDRNNINRLFFHHEGRPADESLAFVPDAWHNNHRLYGIPHIVSWYSSFIQTYFNRIELAILSSFALNPEQKIFEICVNEKVGKKSGSTMREQVHKNDIDNYLLTLKKKFLPKITRKKSRW